MVAGVNDVASATDITIEAYSKRGIAQSVADVFSSQPAPASATMTALASLPLVSALALALIPDVPPVLQVSASSSVTSVLGAE